MSTIAKSPARQKTEQFILQCLEAMVPKGPTTELYKAYFDKISEAEFKQFIDDLATGKSA
jgi:hypothetical protein